MQFCPRCGAQNQDDRAACWKCFGQLQKSDSKKPQRIMMVDADAPASGVRAEPDVTPDVAPAAAPIPELVEVAPEPASPTPDLGFDVPAAAPEIPEPAAVVEPPTPQIPDLGDVAIPSPSFDSVDAQEEESPVQSVPILGLVDLDENEAPAAVDIHEVEAAPEVALGTPTDEPLVVEAAADAQAAEGTDDSSLPWWLAQDETEDVSDDAKSAPTVDLDDELEYISLDDDSGAAPADDDSDTDSEKSPPGA